MRIVTGQGRRAGLAAVVIALALALPSGAVAGTMTTIHGSLMDIDVSGGGQLNARLSGSTSNVFYPPDDPVGRAGISLNFPSTADNDVAPAISGGWSWIFEDRTSLDASTPVVTGDGSAANPFTVVCRYQVGDPASFEITQTVSYVNGTTRFKVHYDVKNISGNKRELRVMEYADLYVEGDDQGIGQLLAGPPRSVLGLNPGVGRSGGVEEVPGSPFTHYEVGDAGSVSDVLTAPDAAGFDDSLASTPVDDALGVQWDDHHDSAAALADGATASYDVVWRFAAPGPISLSPASQTVAPGASASAAVHVTDLAGAPLGGQSVRYAVAGANSASGAVTTNASGDATISYGPSVSGTDTITAYDDLNNNATRDAAEPQATATVAVVAPPVSCPNGMTVPAGSSCPAPPPPPVTCPNGTTLPAGSTCPDVTPASVTLTLATRLRFSSRTTRVKLQVQCSEVAQVQLAPVIGIAKAKKPLVLRALAVGCPPGGAPQQVVVALSRTVRAAIGTAIRHHRAVTFTVTSGAVDGAGNRSPSTTSTATLGPR